MYVEFREQPSGCASETQSTLFQHRGLSLFQSSRGSLVIEHLVIEHQRSSCPWVPSIGVTRACLMYWLSYVGSQGLVPPGKLFTPAQGTYLSSLKLTVFPSIEFFLLSVWIVAGASGLIWFLTFSPLLKFWRPPIDCLVNRAKQSVFLQWKTSVAWPPCCNMFHRTMRSSLFLQSWGLGTELSVNSLLWPLVWFSDLFLLVFFILTPFVSLVQLPNIQLMPQPTLTPFYFPKPVFLPVCLGYLLCSLWVQNIHSASMLRSLSCPTTPAQMSSGPFMASFLLPTCESQGLFLCVDIVETPFFSGISLLVPNIF